MENGHFTGLFDIFERVRGGFGLQFKVSKKGVYFHIWMKLKHSLKKMMNKNYFGFIFTVAVDI